MKIGNGAVVEISDLKYFFAVAETENVNRAAKKIPISPGSLSKAIAKLESELDIRLFERIGRGIQLTEHGRHLKAYARKIIDLEEESRIQIGGIKGHIKLSVAGPEMLLAQFGLMILERLSKISADFSINFEHCDDRRVHQAVSDGSVHLGLTTHAAPHGVSEKILHEVIFKTCSGKDHPLGKRNIKTIRVDEVLRYAFVSPSQPLLGSITHSHSLDGWRDDKFPRNLQFRVTSIDLMARLVTSGHALAYLPEYLANHIGANILKVTGCPFVCKQRVRLLCKRQNDISWLRDLFYSF